MRSRVADRLVTAQVVGCHMGARGVDNPIVRYKTQDDLTDDLCMLEAFGTRHEIMCGAPPPPSDPSGPFF